jgi:hypothetical protein
MSSWFRERSMLCGEIRDLETRLGQEPTESFEHWEYTELEHYLWWLEQEYFVLADYESSRGAF